MAVLRLATATRNAAADAVVDLFDAGAGPGTVEIRSGSQPATANDTATGSLLATVTLADPAFGAASAGVATGTDPASVNWAATGTASWFRAKDSTGATIMDGDVTDNAGTGTMKLSSTAAVSGIPVDITSFTVTMPAS